MDSLCDYVLKNGLTCNWRYYLKMGLLSMDMFSWCLSKHWHQTASRAGEANELMIDCDQFQK